MRHTPTVTTNPLKNKACDGSDDRDAKFPTPSGGTVPGLPQAVIWRLAAWYRDKFETGNVDQAALDAELRRVLMEEEGVFPEYIEIEFERVMVEVFRV